MCVGVYVLACRKLFEIRVGADPVQHVLLFVAVMTKREKYHGRLQGFHPLGLVLQNVRRRVNGMIILGEFERVLVVTMRNSHESVELDLVLFHVFLLQLLPRDFTGNDSCANKVLLC